MSKMSIRIVACVACCLSLMGGAEAVELVIPAKVSFTLNRALGRNYNRYQIANTEAMRIQSAYTNWVSRTMSFDMATRNESLRFGGTVGYYQELPENTAIYVYTQAGQEPLPITGPVPVICKFASNRYSFRKQLDVEATEEVDDGYAVEIVGSFLTNGGYLTTTALDKHETSFHQLREKHAPHMGQPERDVLIFQQVKFRRKFLNAPVINSRISVDFHPDNLEILGFKHYNWTPVNERSPVPIPREEMKDRTETEAVLEQRIREFWSESQTATLTGVEQMWFQTDSELIPMLFSTLEREPTETGCGDVCTIMVNLAGSELVFYASPQIPLVPPVALDCFPNSNPAYDNWKALGSPSCWCYPYQCYGDANNDVHSRGYIVYTTDLTRLSDSWKAKIGDANLDPCSDFAHKSHSRGYVVYTDDLLILSTNWKKKAYDRRTEPNGLRGDCPLTD